MDRRGFLAALAGGAGLLAGPISALAQPAGRVFRLGQLGPGPPTCFTPLHPAETALRQGLEEAGYVVGRNLAIERRCFQRLEVLPDVARALVDSSFDILVVFSAPAALAAKRAAERTPIVFIDASEVFANGLVASLATPGGNATGLTSITREIAAKRLELLREAIPSARRIAILANPESSATAGQVDGIQAAAKPLSLTLSTIRVSSVAEMGRAATELQHIKPDALLVLADPFFFVQQEHIVGLARQTRTPAMYSHTPFVQSGGLIAYAADINDMARRAASYIDRIIKGAKPGDLPVEQPTKFELVINLKTAKALGLTIPSSLLLRADQVIE